MAAPVLAAAAPPVVRPSPSASESAAIVTPYALTASLPPSGTADAALFAVLLAELPATLRASAQAASDRVARHTDQLREAGLPATAAAGDEPDVQVQTLARLDRLGAHVGANYAERLCALRPPFAGVLEVLKFLCKDMWIHLWERQVDNLRTNHRGVYALQVNHFLPLRYLGVANGLNFPRLARPTLAWASGVVRGVLGRMGVPATVSADVLPLPAPADEPAPLGENKFLPPVLFSVKTFAAHPVPASAHGAAPGRPASTSSAGARQSRVSSSGHPVSH